MSKRFTPIYLSFFLILLWVATTSNSSNPPNGRTGAPGDGLCSDCHSGGAGFDGTVSLSGVPAVAMPNTTYPITVSVSNPNGAAVRAGFQWVALNNNNQNTGSLTSAGSGSTVTPSGGRFYHEHSPAQNFGAGTSVSWTVNWTAPPAPANDDNLTFYAASVIANGASGNSGDKVVTAQFNSFMDGGGLPLSGMINNPQDVNCNGGNDGQATANASGGNPPYNYQWSSGSTQMTATNLSAGINSVTITDNDFNSTIADIAIGEPNPIQLDASLLEGIDCETPGGSATANASEGAGNFSYLWPSGETGNTANSLLAGLNTVTVTDNNQCIQTANVFIPEDVAPPNVTLNSNGVLTCDLTSVSATATVTACSNCNYSWSTSNGNITSGTQSATITVDASGTYTLTALNLDNGCSSTEIITVDEDIAEPSISIAAADLLICSIPSTTLSGTVSDCNNCLLSWATNNGNIVQGADTTTPTVDASGTYVLTAINPNNGCSSSEQILVEADFTTPIATITGTEILNCAITSINLISEVDNCTSCTIIWSSPDASFSSINNGEDISVSMPGTFTLEVTNQINGCTTSTTTIINQDIQAPSVDAGDDGMLNCNITQLSLGSTVSDCVNCAYNWTTLDGQIIGGANAATAIVNAAGTYTLVATNTLNSCASMDEVVVTETTPPSINIISTNPASCNGEADGTATVTTDNGTAPFTYNWSSGGTASTETGLLAGVYSITSTDMDGCTDVIMLTITEPDVLIANASVNAETTSGGNDGIATANPSGGTAPYSYLWSNDSTSQSITDLPPGFYTVTVADANNCTSNQTVSVSDFSCSLLATTVSSNLSCNGSMDGSIMVDLENAVQPINISWSNGSSENMIDDLAAGQYSLTVTDGNNCSTTASVTLTEPTSINTQLTSTNVSCFGGNDGTINVDISGSTPPYTINYPNDGDGTGLSADTYTISITDVNNCEDTIDVTITQAEALEVEATIQNVSCFGGNDGSVSLDITGGTPPYLPNWPNGGDGTNLPAGTYNIVVTDANDCESSINFTITQVAQLSIAVTPQDVSCFGGNDGSASIATVGGTPPYNFEWSNGGNGSDLVAGDYMVTVTDANLCQEVTNFQILQPNVLTLSILNQSPITCIDADGSMTVMADGGTPSYTYMWSDGTVGPMNESPANANSVSVTDANGCVNIISVELTTDVLPPSLAIQQGDPLEITCSNETVNIQVNVSDCPQCLLEWTTDNGTIDGPTDGETIVAAAAGMYIVNASNPANGCSATLTIPVTETPAVELILTDVINVSCAGANDGQIIFELINPVPPISLIWNPAIDPSQGLPPDNYELTALDDNGCASMISFTVLEPAPLAIELDDILPSTNGNNDGEINITTSGGTGGYTYAWFLNSLLISTEEDPTGVASGAYLLQIMDEKNCLLEEIIELGNINATTEIEVSLAIQLFPNPANEVIYFELNTSAPIDLSITMYAVSGEQVWQGFVEDAFKKAERIDVSRLPSGVYWLRFQSLDGVSVKKIVIK